MLLADEGTGQQWLGERLEFMRSVRALDGKATAFVCDNFVYRTPVMTVPELRALLLQKRSE